ncbi:hypothetical protein MPLSOD_40361 [Mesorhizobium sp. SOD10]|nr:hypothetical protein MPLSOD_40361 [Mesorhizobium sp. SOD10]
MNGFCQASGQGRRSIDGDSVLLVEQRPDSMVTALELNEKHITDGAL